MYLGNKRGLRSLICWLLLLPLILINLFPFIVMFFTALKPADEVFSWPPHWLPRTWMWSNFSTMWTQSGFKQALFNSIFVSFTSTLLTIFLAIPAAYAMARFRFRGYGAYHHFLLFTQMLSPILMVIGLFKLAALTPWGSGTLVDTHAALIIGYAAFGLAFATWMMATYFESIPKDIEEAAWLEGCSAPQALFKVFLPLAAPAVAVTFVFCFVNAWNEFAMALTILRSTDRMTLTLLVANQVSGRYTVEWQFVMAAALLATLPVTAVFIYLQRYLVKGLAIGAVK